MKSWKAEFSRAHMGIIKLVLELICLRGESTDTEQISFSPSIFSYFGTTSKSLLQQAMILLLR